MYGRRRCRAWPLLLWLVSGMAQAAGSWVERAPSLHVGLVDREAISAPLESHGQSAAGRVIGDVRWRFQLPPGSTVAARLCHPGGCVPLSGQRGMTRALEGLAADVPLRFRFALKAGQAPLSVEGLQVIVNYR
ncbi:flagellar protein FlhE [Halomonas elongata]|uniref:Flagellar protein FlhE n=2 Tax=Halomonas elongata TaxID=2746 RepID=E1VBQ9_HALED|nr:flagellar protein FlhE [Halomonas elongata]WBF17982.1 flagellar protein FlhE [Halomonas elongata]WPU46830.1 flagellar protein FlhE [Halomonas elongata DSM 2581]CBV44216.1 flagellar protein FlhE [Halomonas elongata DSM 2581]